MSFGAFIAWVVVSTGFGFAAGVVTGTELATWVGGEKDDLLETKYHALLRFMAQKIGETEEKLDRFLDEMLGEEDEHETDAHEGRS